MFSLSRRIWAPIIVASICVVSARAQQQQPPPPPPTTNPTQPAAPVQPLGSPDNKQPGSKDEPASPVQAPATVVTGGLAPKVAEVSEARSQVIFGFQVSESFNSNFAGASTPGNWSEITNFGGHFDLHRLGRSSDLMIRYVGGGLLDPQNSSFNSTYHQFEVGETLQFRRWTLQLADLFSYLPSSSFGFQLYGVGQTTVGGIVLLNPGVPPSQSILTTQTARLSNVLLAQAQVIASQRTTFTFTGGYGLLHYTTAGFLDPNNTNIGFGYNYALNSRDTLGVSYQYNNYSFSPSTASINDSAIVVSYGHHISRHLLFQVGGGPEMDYFKPVGSSTSMLNTSFNANASLTYEFNRTTVSAMFLRGVNGGAGILIGSTADTAQVAVSRQFSRKLTISGDLGYSFNQSLPQASLVTTSYNALYVGGALDYKISRTGDFFVNYTFTHQTVSGPACVGVACAVPFGNHQIWVGFNFDFRPIPLY
jgi:hypothetical protein